MYNCTYISSGMHVIEIELDHVFQALSDFTRVRIVRLLADTDEEICLCELSEALQEPEAKLSRHVKILRQAGLLSAFRDGKWIYHSLVTNQPYLKNLKKMVTAFPDSSGVFAKDFQRFSKRLKLREQGRCRSPNFSKGREQARSSS